jgi:hypothetical protein
LVIPIVEAKKSCGSRQANVEGHIDERLVPPEDEVD